MYMKNNRAAYDKYGKYNLNEFPANYSGQLRKIPVKKNVEDIIETSLSGENQEFEEKAFESEHSAHNEHKNHSNESNKHNEKHEEEHEKKHEDKKEHHNSLIGGLLRGGKDGNNGILGKIFGEKDGKGIIGGLELEDLILLAVIFFLLKDGVEDDFLIILALILLAWV